MVAVAAPRAEGSVQVANFIDAIGDRIAASSDEIASNDSEVGAKIVGHIYGATHLCARHVTAEVNIADLHDLHSVESGRQIGQGNLDATNLIIQALRSETIHGTQEGGGAGSSRGRAEKVAAPGIGNGLSTCWRGWRWRPSAGYLLRCGVEPSSDASA